MKVISVGQLRQNPTSALADVEAGSAYAVTRHNREIARSVPPSAHPDLVPPADDGPAHTTRLPRIDITTADSVDDLLDSEKGEW